MNSGHLIKLNIENRFEQLLFWVIYFMKSKDIQSLTLGMFEFQTIHGCRKSMIHTKLICIQKRE